MLDLQYEKYKDSENFLVLKNPPNLLDYSKYLNEKFSDTSNRYKKGLNILLAVVESYSLFEKYSTSNFCPECGKMLKQGEICKHKEDVFDLYDEKIDKFTYLGFMSFEKFSILHTFNKKLLAVLESKGSKNLR